MVGVSDERGKAAASAADLTAELEGAAPPDVQATFCATLVDQWIADGVRHAVIAPGSRSTPMATAIAVRPELDVHVVHDERVAAFIALGLGIATHDGSSLAHGRSGVPALLLCTSGTAAANFMPAVAEAGLSEIPMLVLTADRPPELRGVGAPQTIDQIELYGRHVRWFHDPDVPDAATSGSWRPLAREAFRRARTGPVHLNLPFREPLLGTPAALPGDDGADPGGGTVPGPGDPVPDTFDQQRGVILVGGAHDVAAGEIERLAAMTSWPVVADAQSGMRGRAGVVTAVDSLLRHGRFADDHAPDVVVRVGRPSSSKVLARWTARDDLTLVQVGGPGVIDPAGNVTARCSIDALLAARPSGATGTTWASRWAHAEQRVAAALTAELAEAATLTEPVVARLLADHLPAGADLTVSSSMPVRDLEWFGGPGASAHANRGANGIDGVTSTAVGRLLARRPRLDEPVGVVLIGDLAFVHDSNALVDLRRRGIDLRIVVVDNDGGGIFSFLPQATALPADRFELLFGTPLGTDVLRIAEAHGLPTRTLDTPAALIEQLGRPGPWVVRVATDRAQNVDDHARLHATAIAALD